LVGNIGALPRDGLSPEAAVLVKIIAQGPRDLPVGCFWVDAMMAARRRQRSPRLKLKRRLFDCASFNVRSAAAA
jgi:hypothetical protein